MFLNTMSIELKSVLETENRFVRYKAVINLSSHFINFEVTELFLLKHSKSNFNVTDVYYEKSSDLNKRSLMKKKSDSFYSSITSFIQSVKRFQQRSSKLSNINIFILH